MNPKILDRIRAGLAMAVMRCLLPRSDLVPRGVVHIKLDELRWKFRDCDKFRRAIEQLTTEI